MTDRGTVNLTIRLIMLQEEDFLGDALILLSTVKLCLHCVSSITI